MKFLFVIWKASCDPFHCLATPLGVPTLTLGTTGLDDINPLAPGLKLIQYFYSASWTTVKISRLKKASTGKQTCIFVLILAFTCVFLL